MADRYWVAASEANWTDTANWSATSGGAGGASVPGSADNVFFDGNGLGNCITVNSHTILALNMDAAYTGILYQTNTAKTFNRGLTVTADSVVGTGCVMAGGSTDPSVMDVNSCRLTFNGGAFVNGNVNASLGTNGELFANTTWGGTVAASRHCGIAGTIAGNISLITSFNNYTVTIIGNLTAEGSFSVGSPGQTGNAISNAGNHNLTFKGNVTFDDATYTAGTGTITLDPSGVNQYDFNGQTIEGVHVNPDALGTVTLTGNVTSSWLRDCGSLINLNGFTWTYDNVDRCVVPYNPTAPPTLALKSGESINNGLVGWWALTETDDYVSGAADIGSNSYDLTKIGTVTSEPSSLGGTAYFDGSADYLQNTSLTTSSFPWTLSAWGYYSGSGTSRDTLLSIGCSTSDTPYSYIYFDNTAGTAAGSTRCSATGFPVQIITSSITAGNWYHLVWVQTSQTSSELYVNGVSVGTDTTDLNSAPTPALDQVQVGVLDRTSPINDMLGIVQNARIWSTALTAQQVSDIYTTPWLGSNYEAVVGNTYFFPASFGGRL